MLADILRRIFENLIRNALVHGEGDCHVCIEVVNQYTKISIRNRAPNLREDQIERLFDRFYTSDPSRRMRTTGLGLAIARRLTELLDGEIGAHKQDEHFVVVIRFRLMDKQGVAG